MEYVKTDLTVTPLVKRMTREAVVGEGCFWCIEAAYKEVNGVEIVTSGYAGGRTDSPTYREVCTGSTGHAEVVKIEYDEARLTYRDILELFFRIHDPTTRDRQGPDTGTQYRSIILYTSEEQREQAEEFIRQKKADYEDEIVTELEPLEQFWEAEEEHQDYFEKNPDDAYCNLYAGPKIEKVRQMSE